MPLPYKHLRRAAGEGVGRCRCGRPGRRRRRRASRDGRRRRRASRAGRLQARCGKGAGAAGRVLSPADGTNMKQPYLCRSVLHGGNVWCSTVSHRRARDRLIAHGAGACMTAMHCSYCSQPDPLVIASSEVAASLAGRTDAYPMAGQCVHAKRRPSCALERFWQASDRDRQGGRVRALEGPEIAPRRNVLRVARQARRHERRRARRVTGLTGTRTRTR